MSNGDDDDIDIVSFLIIFCIICCIIAIGMDMFNNYDEFKYTHLNAKNISSFQDFIDFVIFLCKKFYNWILKLLGLRHQPALPLTSDEEYALDAADPGSLADVLILLKQGQVRQAEDFETADQALNDLEASIEAGDAMGTFVHSDESVSAEEALSWRSWILAQTSEMAHNMSNMEICNSAGNSVIDFMDLPATGKGAPSAAGMLSSILGDDDDDAKKAKDFRWSNRCENIEAMSFTDDVNCILNLPEPEKDKYWIIEKDGTDSRTSDEIAFNTGNFSGYNCEYYAKHFCEDGKPNYDNHLDMFGARYNWPELNCCACGGGNHMNSLDIHKFELITNNCPLSVITDLGLNTNSEDLCTKSINECMDECNNAPKCKGLMFNIESSNVDSTHHPDRRKLKINSASTGKIYKVTDSIDNEKVKKIFTRNPADTDSCSRSQLPADNTGGGSVLPNYYMVLKKQASTFQNFSGVHNGSIFNIFGEDTDGHGFPYGLPINGKTCADYDKCPSDEYRPVLNPEQVHCNNDVCLRKDCCILNKCSNSNKICDPGETLTDELCSSDVEVDFPCEGDKSQCCEVHSCTHPAPKDISNTNGYYKISDSLEDIPKKDFKKNADGNLELEIPPFQTKYGIGCNGVHGTDGKIYHPENVKSPRFDFTIDPFDQKLKKTVNVTQNPLKVKCDTNADAENKNKWYIDDESCSIQPVTQSDVSPIYPQELTTAATFANTCLQATITGAALAPVIGLLDGSFPIPDSIPLVTGTLKNMSVSYTDPIFKHDWTVPVPNLPDIYLSRTDSVNLISPLVKNDIKNYLQASNHDENWDSALDNIFLPANQFNVNAIAHQVYCVISDNPLTYDCNYPNGNIQSICHKGQMYNAEGCI